MRNASGFLLLFAENCSENQAHKRTAIKHLVADCHREIHRPCLHPCCKRLRFLYKGIIIKHNKTEPTYTKTSLFLCEKRRFFMARTEKGVVTTI